MRDAPAATDLLAWYGRHARTMPWRVPPPAQGGTGRADPYRVWLSEVMLQQTTVAAVTDYFNRFTARWPDVAALAAAEDGDVMAQWAGLGYYARARNLLKCARVVASQYQGQFPNTYQGLLALPGIGPYTAAAISAIAFDQPETVVDGNVERVMARLFDVHTPLPTAKAELTRHAATLTPIHRPGDYAQAVMDLGATICTPRNPACSLCPWQGACQAFKNGTAPQLPKKTPKKPKPTRLGHAYVGQRADGAWLLERRADSGLLGGMLGWPGGPWHDEGQVPPAIAPLPGAWVQMPQPALHTFTHFHLRLIVWVAALPLDAAPTAGHFVTHNEFRPSDLPTVMRKVFEIARPAFLAAPQVGRSHGSN
ncbi:MAG: A/G-specific adenine glycosylase [Rhodobacteraceae bacterium]|nr:A/G-specific adenine glycosylase [Paracoccaceae bacterium]